MLTLMASLFVAALLSQSPDSTSLSGTVVDAAGKPLPDVEVILWARMLATGSAPALAHTTTDAQGLFRFQVARQPLPGLAPQRFFLAIPPGRTVAVGMVNVWNDGAPAPVRLTVAEPLRRTLTVLGPDDRPLAGVRLAPVLCALDETVLFQMPDDRLEQFTITSDAHGVAALPYFPSGIDPMKVRVTAPGIAPHDLPLLDRPARDRITLKLGRPARLAGSVYFDSGQPAAAVPIEVRVENTHRMPNKPDVEWKVSESLIRFDTGPLRTQADGSFVTPQQLLTGSSYQIIVRPQAGPPVTSNWLKATGELTTFPPFRLKQHRKLRGLVLDRHGKPVAGARIFLPSGEPSTATDAQGWYLLEGMLPDKTYLLVKAVGFRFQGWPAIPAREPRDNKLILARTSEPPDRIMAPQPPPISPEEARALARRLLEPSLQAALVKGEDRLKWACLRFASRTDPARVLELLEKHPFQDADRESSIRKIVATEFLATDSAAAESIIKAIPKPEYRAWAYVELAAALPDHEPARKRKLLELATVDVQDPAARARDAQSRRVRLGQVARAWLDLGDVDKARPLIREGFELVGVLPKAMPQFDDRFLSTAARIEPDRVLSLIGNLGPAERRPYYARIVESLAIEHPAEAERVFQLCDDSPRTLMQVRTRIALQHRLCLRLATSDPVRARRIISGIAMPRDQATGWALLALGLADRDKQAASTALAESIQVIDRLVDSAKAVKPDPNGSLVASNPAALILPVVEKVAPQRLEEVFWKALALKPNDDLAQKRGIADPRIAQAAIVLARYDRQVADVFVTQAFSTMSSSRGAYDPLNIRAKACVDPHGAVTLMESLVPPGVRDLRPSPNNIMYEARDELLIYPIEPDDHHWQYVWRQSGVHLDEREFP
jgi:hypothetical protein